MLYNKNKKEVVKRSYAHLYTQEGVTDKVKKRRKTGRTLLSGRPKK